MSTAGDIPIRDWQGSAIDCAVCPHHALLAQGQCEPGRSCMQDAYARRIDRFFRSHPDLAHQHTAHPYFEVRAIAARYVNPFYLPQLMHDPDETVRLQVALRLPLRRLTGLVPDPHREVRIRVAQRLPVEQLPAMLNDSDYEVRLTVARRITPVLLSALLQDPDLQVRCVVAQRLPMPALLGMLHDSAPEVRRILAWQLPEALLAPLGQDEDWLVRHAVAARATGATLTHLLQDPEPDVRLRAQERQRELAPTAPVSLSRHTPHLEASHEQPHH